MTPEMTNAEHEAQRARVAASERLSVKRCDRQFEAARWKAGRP